MPLRRANKYFNTVFNRGRAHTCAHTFRPLATAVEHCSNAHSPKIIITIIIIHSTRGTTHTQSAFHSECVISSKGRTQVFINDYRSCN